MDFDIVTNRMAQVEAKAKMDIEEGMLALRDSVNMTEGQIRVEIGRVRYSQGVLHGLAEATKGLHEMLWTANHQEVRTDG